MSGDILTFKMPRAFSEEMASYLAQFLNAELISIESTDSEDERWQSDPHFLAELRESEAQKDRGEVTRFASAEDAIAYFDSL